MEKIPEHDKKPETQENVDNQEITIRLQTFDNIYPITISKNLTIENLKKKITEKFNIPLNSQKIIYQGRVLLNSEKINACRIYEDSVVHLLVKNMEEQNANTTINNTNTNASGNIGGGLGSRLNDNPHLDDMLSSVIEIPIIRSTRRQRRRQNTAFDISESFESMHQNIVSIQNILNCRAKFDETKINQTRTIVPFDLTKIKFEPGQWVDAKDTIDQWIEAQVVNVRNNQAYIHYNGWGARWDEYIDFNSPRLAPFKTHSINNIPSGCYSSPYPAIVPDANIDPLQRNLDTFYYIDKAMSFINEVVKLMDQINKCRKKSK